MEIDGNIKFMIIMGFALIGLILGFWALLKQKTYMDVKTNEIVDIEIPFFGKIKSQYPSLIIIFLSFGLVLYLLSQGNEIRKKTWDISGQFVSNEINKSWDVNGLSIHPCDINPTLDKDTGVFKFSLEIEEGKSFEDVYEAISYTDKYESVFLEPQKELAKYNSDKEKNSSLIAVENSIIRQYKPIKLIKMQGDRR